MDELLVERAAGVVTATINLPHVRNALDDASFKRCALFVEVVARDEERVVVLTGAGGTFSSGGDLRPAHPTGWDTATLMRRFGRA